MPDFELVDLQGRTWRLADLKGKTAFVNVWATWCAPCRKEMPHLQRLYDRVKGRPDVVLLTMNVDEKVRGGPAVRDQERLHLPGDPGL